MKSKIRSNSKGFTIVEVLIVLAVTGLMFLGVVIAISGKQQAAQFQTSLNDIRSKLQQISNEVSAGYFPNNDNFSCTAIGGKIQLTSGTSSTAGECIYIGKALHFYKTAANLNNTFSAYTIVGLNNDTAASYADTKPFLLAPVTAHADQNPTPNQVNTIENTILQYGLTVVKLTYSDDNGINPLPAGSFAFVQSLNTGVTNLDGGATHGAAQHVDLMAFTGGQSSLDFDTVKEADTLDSDFASGSFVLNRTITICLKSGTTNQWGVITIDAQSSQMDIASHRTNQDCSV